jgi:exosome complex component RRP43
MHHRVPTPYNHAASNNMSVLPADVLQQLNPALFHRQFFAEGVRTDRRALEAARRTTIAHSDNAERPAVAGADGSALVKLGHTVVLCGISLEVGVPQSVNPKNGRLAVSVSLPAACAPRFANAGGAAGARHKTPLELSTGEVVSEMIAASGALTLSNLCIREGKSAWVLYADVVFIEFAGNVVDAAALAVVAALRNLRLPETSVDADGDVRRTRK